jgi:DNA-binding NtrC family response regulator
MPHALIIDDDSSALDALSELVAQEGLDFSTAKSMREAYKKLEQDVPDLILTDLFLPDGSGMELLDMATPPQAAEIVVITGHASVETAVEALRAGAVDYLVKPIDVQRLRTILKHVKRALDLEEEIGRLRKDLRELGRFGPIVGVSAPMQRLYELAARVAPSEATVFITGESGTGKEVLACTLHELSKRRKGPLVAVNCGALSPSLIESELFGHERGSFTGAERQHRGFFERASGGTLFLDEIAEMPLELQVKLLRVLETSTVQRVGGEAQIPIDVRVIAASNRPPEEAVSEGKLRSDLLYRLKVFSLHLVPLRERGDDAVLLAEHFVSQLNKQSGESKAFDHTAIEVLRNYSWPGNVRELKNVIEHSFILAEAKITRECLPAELTPDAAAEHLPGNTDGPISPGVRFEVGMSLADVERRIILLTLDHYGGDKKRAASVLGVSVKTIYNRLNSYRS